MSRSFISNSEANNSDWESIQPFLARIFVFLIPFILIASAMELTLWNTGDLWTPQYALNQQQQSAQESIYGPGVFSDQFNIYKLSGIRYRQPSILSIGSSRVMQMRDFMFHPLKKQFYNGGGLLRNAFDLQAFAKMLAHEELPLPKVIIVGLDPWWLRTNYGKTTWLYDPDEHYSFAGHIEAFRHILKTGSLQNVFSATLTSKSSGFEYDAIGTSARIDGAGFRRDGSSLYPPKMLLDFLETPVYVDRESPPIIDRIQMTKREFSLPAIIDAKRVNLILEALVMIQEKGVEVIAFMPPFSTEAFEALETSPPLSQWWNFYIDEFPTMIKNHDIQVVQVSHPRQYGLDDTYMFDGWHPSEVYMAHLMQSIIVNSSQKSYFKNIDLQNLRSIINHATIPLAFKLPGKPLETFQN